MSDFTEGDQVVLKPSWGWTQPWRRFADEKRVGEIVRAFTAAGDRPPTYCVRFPVKRRGAVPRQIFLDAHDIKLADAESA